MSKMIQIRHVPDHLHQQLKERASANGMSLSDYLLGELEEIAGKPTLPEWVEMVRGHLPREGAPTHEEIAAAIREGRGE
jgi:hypothetical protein